LDEAERILEKIDILHLEFAKRAAVSCTTYLLFLKEFEMHTFYTYKWFYYLLPILLGLINTNNYDGHIIV
jgi:hypothetical protein